MKYGRIQDGRVVECVELDAGYKIADIYPPSMVWVPLPTGVGEGYIYNGGTSFSKPPAPPEPDFETKVAAFRIAIQTVLDAKAIELGYDSIAAAVTYAEEPAVPKFQLEGRSLRAWRSLVWDACYTLLAQVQAGTAPEPSREDVLAALPDFAMLEASE